MQICRFNDNRLGVVRDNRVYDVSAVLDRLPVFRYPLPEHDPLIAALPELRPIIEAMLAGAHSVDLASVRLLPPVASPRKIVAAPVNYRKHIEEARSDAAIHHHQTILDIDRAGLFLKATSSLIGPSDPVMIRHADRRNDHEIELVAVIGKTADRVTPEEALAYVAGYCVGLDMTVRGTEERSMRKSVDTFSVIGPWMVTADEIADPGQLGLELRVNGELRQQASTADLLRDLPSLIALASSFYTLRPGDLLFTGTPEGVGAVKPGDTITAWIESIGTMQVAVH
ncbi:fumarylacetoacetate hydrolase family protein [Devosia sp. A449]